MNNLLISSSQALKFILIFYYIDNLSTNQFLSYLILQNRLRRPRLFFSSENHFLHNDS